MVLYAVLPENVITQMIQKAVDHSHRINKGKGAKGTNRGVVISAAGGAGSSNSGKIQRLPSFTT